MKARSIEEKLEAWRFNVALECSGASLNAIEAIAIGGAVLKLSDLHDVLEWVASADRSPEGGDPQGLHAQHESAVPKGDAQ